MAGEGATGIIDGGGATTSNASSASISPRPGCSPPPIDERTSGWLFPSGASAGRSDSGFGCLEMRTHEATPCALMDSITSSICSFRAIKLPRSAHRVRPTSREPRRQNARRPFRAPAVHSERPPTHSSSCSTNLPSPLPRHAGTSCRLRQACLSYFPLHPPVSESCLRPSRVGVQRTGGAAPRSGAGRPGEARAGRGAGGARRRGPSAGRACPDEVSQTLALSALLGVILDY